MTAVIKTGERARIWFDFENAPHVWVLKPLLTHFTSRGYPCHCSARDFSYTARLLRSAGIKADIQPVRETRNKAAKVINLLARAARLAWLFRNRNIDIAVGHGSRSQIVAARILGIPVISMDDYEKSDQFLVRYTARTLVPAVISKSNWGRFQDRVVHYPGLKENIYMDGFDFDRRIRSRLGVDDNKVIVLLRPETASSHYHDPKSSQLLRSILRYLGAHGQAVEVVLLPRNKRQEKEICAVLERLKVAYVIPDPERYGFEIVSAADLVIGGGGTMLREAACLNIPAFSYFAGQWGSVDDHLAAVGRLVKITGEDDLEKIDFVKRTETKPASNSGSRDFIISYIEDYLQGLR
jgi:predicted glycosyltransferase